MSGLQIPGHAACDEVSAADPLAAIRALGAQGDSDTSTLLVLFNFHRFLQSAEIVQSVLQQLERSKQQRTFLIVVAPVIQLPPELERQFVVIEHPLPAREELLEIAWGVATEPDDLPAGVELERVIDAAAGLTRQEAENAFALALVRHGHLEPSTLWQLKAQTLAKGGLLALHHGTETFDGLGGLEALKAFCRRALRTRSAGRGSALPVAFYFWAFRAPVNRPSPSRWATRWAGRRSRLTWGVSWVRSSAKAKNARARRWLRSTPWRHAFCSSTRLTRL